MRAAITLLAIVLTGACAGGQDKDNAKPGTGPDRESKKGGSGEKSGDEGPRVVGHNLPQPAAVVPPPPPDADKATIDAYNRALKSNYEYVEWSNDYRRRTHEWQSWSSKAVFYACVSVVVIGLWFSWLQFRDARDVGSRRSVTERSQTTAEQSMTSTGVETVGIEAARPKQLGTPGSSITHSLEASAAGVKVTTPVLGVVILALSLAFFYLYLQFIYPIRPVSG